MRLNLKRNFYVFQITWRRSLIRQQPPFSSTSYLELYRVEKFQCAKAKNYSLNNEVFKAIPVAEYEQTQNNDFILAAGQWSYLCHQLRNEQYAQDCIKGAIDRVQRIAFVKWSLRSHCSTCNALLIQLKNCSMEAYYLMSETA